jgi:hypothetical protein
MTKLYVPAFSVLTAFPFILSEMVKPGPTVPLSFGVACDAENALPAARSTTAAASASITGRPIAYLLVVVWTGVLRVGCAGGLAPSRMRRVQESVEADLRRRVS